MALLLRAELLACFFSRYREQWVAAWVVTAVGGSVIDVQQQNEVILERLSMPHSSRFHQRPLCRGQFGYVDLARGVFEPAAFCAGDARGLAFHADYAVVGLSQTAPSRGLGSRWRSRGRPMAFGIGTMRYGV